MQLLHGARRAPAVLADDEGRRASAQARRGSPLALAEIYDANHTRVRQLARRLLGDDAAAEDLVQEIFEQLPRALKRFRGASSLETFLFAMVVNRTRAHLRGAIRRRRALERLTREPTAPAASLDDDLHTRRRAAEIIAALDQLPLAQRVAFVLCEVQEMSAGEVSKLTGVPEATVRTRVFHARRRLRDLMQPGGGS